MTVTITARNLSELPKSFAEFIISPPAHIQNTLSQLPKLHRTGVDECPCQRRYCSSDCVHRPENQQKPQSSTLQFIVFDSRTGTQVAGPFSVKSRAYRKADALDSQYGAIRYAVRSL